MSPHAQARTAYNSAPVVQTPRDVEYMLFARVTSGLRAIDETDPAAFPKLAAALIDNQRLWSMLESDLSDDGNKLDLKLRANLVSLARFVVRHTNAVLGGKASIEPLIDINMMIMKGLRGEAEVAA